ncbi:MAG: P-loop NTPase [Gemmatimonadota bacterium]
MVIRTYHQLTGPDASGLGAQVQEQAARVAQRIREVDSVIAVMSGKGGVGKSLVSAVLATALRRDHGSIGLLDADLNGPTAARMLGVRSTPLEAVDRSVRPAISPDGVVLMSMALLLSDAQPVEWREPGSDSFVWRGAQERGALREFLSDVEWGSLDFLLVDLPPVTQRLLELHELVPALAGVVAVTAPSEAARESVERSLTLCRRRGIELLGIVENMSGYHCPTCETVGPLFPGEAGRTLASRFRVPLLGRIPFDCVAGRLAEAGRMGELLARTEAGRALREIARRIVERLHDRGSRD